MKILMRQGRKITAAVVLATFLFLTSPSHAETMTFEVLKLKVGSRAIAMGGAYTALANTIDATYYNPAGLFQIESTEVAAMHSEWFVDSRYEYAAFALPLKKIGGFGLNVVWFNTGIMVTDSLGVESGLVGINDIIITAGVGVEPLPKMFPNLYVGVSFKYAYESLYYLSNTAYMGSLGLLYKFDDMPLSLGVVAENLGVTVSNNPLPFTIRAGVAYKLEDLGFKDASSSGGKKGVSSSANVLKVPTSGKSGAKRGGGGRQSIGKRDSEYDVILCGDFIQTLNASYTIAFGAEVILPVKFTDYLRARIGGNSTGGVFNITGGLGFYLDTFVFEYALSNSELGLAHQPQITYRF